MLLLLQTAIFAGDEEKFSFKQTFIKNFGNRQFLVEFKCKGKISEEGEVKVGGLTVFVKKPGKNWRRVSLRVLGLRRLLELKLEAQKLCLCSAAEKFWPQLVSEVCPLDESPTPIPSSTANPTPTSTITPTPTCTETDDCSEKCDNDDIREILDEFNQLIPSSALIGSIICRQPHNEVLRRWVRGGYVQGSCNLIPVSYVIFGSQGQFCIAFRQSGEPRGGLCLVEALLNLCGMGPLAKDVQIIVPTPTITPTPTPSATP